MVKILFNLFVLSFLLIGCSIGNDAKELRVITIENASESTPTAADISLKAKDTDWTIKHRVNGQNVYFECFIPNFQFMNPDQSNSSKPSSINAGYLNVYIDGGKAKPIYKAAFILKDLEVGKHKITLELVNENGQPLTKANKIITIAG